jgi:TM2 domain-containing membrane protein YozV
MSNDSNNHHDRQQQIVVVQESQALAAIMAFFFSGIGQLIQGRAVAGLLWLFTEVILGGILLIMTFGLGLVFTLPTRVLCIVDAAIYKPREGKPLGKLVIAGLCVNGGGLLLAILMWAGAIGSAAMQ